MTRGSNLLRATEHSSRSLAQRPRRLNGTGNFRLSRPAVRAAPAYPGRMNHRAGGSVSSSLHPPAG